MTVQEIEREMDLKTIETYINNLKKGIQRENQKHYFKEENRQKKINELNKKLNFWYDRLASIEK